MAKSEVIIKNRMKEVLKNIKHLPSVLVGIPDDQSAENRGPQIGSNLRTTSVTDHDVALSDMTNAQIAYIMEKGAPEVNIPSRAFLIPGIRSARDRYVPHLRKAAQAALTGSMTDIEKSLHSAGMIAVSAVQRRIREGIPPPLKASTVRARRRRSKGSKYRRKATTAAQTTPLIDSGQMNRALTYVIDK